MNTTLIGDCRTLLSSLPDASVQCCVTSPPYFGLRDYGVKGQCGLEPTPDAFVANLVEVFREVRRVLKSDGTCWVNIGDSYAGSWGNQGRKETRGTQRPINGAMMQKVNDGRYPTTGTRTGVIRAEGVKPKDLYGIPWMLAFALRADGWYLRQDIIWSKPNPMPESIADRCTKSHEYVFLLSKSLRYYYDADAVKEPPSAAPRTESLPGRNRRSVWTVNTKPFKGAHFATFPPKLIEPCILAGTKAGDTVLDPFGGSGTTAIVANWHGRDSILIELNPAYVPLIEQWLRTRA